MAGALLLLAAFGLLQAVARRRDTRERRRSRALVELRLVADSFEGMVAEELRVWLEELPGSSDPAALEARIRRRVPWFEGWYLWDPEAGPIFPPAPAAEDRDGLEADPCLRAAVAGAPILGESFRPDLYRLCAGRPRQAALLSTSLAADLLLSAGRPHDAIATLEQAGIPSLAQAREERVSPRRAVIQRLQAARAHRASADPGGAAAILRSLLDELADLDAPAAAGVLDLCRTGLPPEIHALGLPELRARAEAVTEGLRRRVEGWKALDRLLGSGDPPAIAADPVRLSSDPLLVALRAGASGPLSVVQLDTGGLLSNLPESPGGLVVVDRAGRPVSGGRAARGPAVAFTDLLDHLRLAFGRAPPGAAHPWSLLGPPDTVLPIALAALMGGVALLAAVRADRRGRELLERQREFGTRVTHELKTPLAGIRLLAENLELGAVPDSETTRVFARRITGEADRLARRVDEILRVSRSREPGRRGKVELVELVEGLAEEWQPRMEDAGVAFLLDLKQVPPLHDADPELLRDAISCLMDNALKYRREDHPYPLVWVRLRRQRRQAIVEIEDNGIGVPPGQRRKVFERFARVEGPGRGKAGGHGLGLAFAAEAIELHGGQVDCLDGRDGGARFVVRLPLKHRRRTRG